MFLIDILFPKRCVSCGRIGDYVCCFCQKQIVAINPETGSICPVCERPAIQGRTHPRCRGEYQPDGLTAFFYYQGPLKKILKNIKYQHSFDMVKKIDEIIPPTSYNFIKSTVGKKINLIVPTPLHPQRLRDRGFNQTYLISKCISKKLSVPVEDKILIRVKNTPPQAGMASKNKRFDNIKSAFTVEKNYKICIKDMTVLLIDDIFTTGATARSACRELKKAGARYVWCIAIAR